MAITYISSNARPSDNSTFGGNANNSLLINAVGAATGDLVVVIAQYRGATTIVVDETGGQTWNTLTAFIDAGNLCQVRYFWCRWSDETANGNNPNFFANGIAGNPFTCAGFIFRPTTSTNLWGVDVALSSTQFSAPSTPFTVNRTGVTTTNASTVTIASWHTADVNTWNTLSGTGWSSLGDAQNRNATGGGQSATQAYKVMTSASATGDVSKNQATNGGDAGVTGIISFYEYAATSPISGTASGTSAATSALTGKGRIAGLSTGTSTATGGIIGKGRIAGLSAGSATATSNITARANITGQAAGTSTSSSSLRGRGYILGFASGTSTATIRKTVSGNTIKIGLKSEIRTSIKGKSTIKNIVIHE